MTSINSAAVEALADLRRRYPTVPIGVIGESLGSGAASYLCSRNDPPDRVVLIVPFADLLSVAKEHLPFLPVSWLLRDKWDNVRALSSFRGRVDIYGAVYDTVIPIHHAQRLAGALPGAVFHEMTAGHNDWSSLRLVKISE
jgi:pimeloyl-ACP methyl ester carboxylesterase